MTDFAVMAPRSWNAYTPVAAAATVAAVVQQTWDSTTGAKPVLIFSSSQGPYQLRLLEDNVTISESSATSAMSTDFLLYGLLSALVAGAIIAVILAIVAVRRRRQAARLFRQANSESIALGAAGVKRQARWAVPRAHHQRSRSALCSADPELAVGSGGARITIATAEGESGEGEGSSVAVHVGPN